MAPRTIYANLADGLQPFNLWDQSLADMGKLGTIPCIAAGTNAIVLTPITTVFAPTVTIPQSLETFSFVAAASSSGAVTIQIGTTAALKLYRMDGVTQASTGDIVNTVTYLINYNAALNSAVGGFQILAPIANEINPIISGATITGSTITTSTYNGNTWTAGTGTLTIAAGKTETFNNTLTFAGTDGTTMTFPATSATVARTDAANTFTGTQTIGALVATTFNGNTLTAGSYTLNGVAAKTLTFNNTLTLAGTDGTVMTFPTTSATLARTDAANTFTGHQTIEGVTSTGATGTGNLVFSASPTFTAPVLGAATATTINGAIVSPGQFSGTTTNDNATAGNRGEYIASVIPNGSGVSVTSTVAATITSISLTAGDWDVGGNAVFLPAAGTTTSECHVAIGLVAATIPTNNGSSSASHASIPASQASILPAGIVRFSLSGTTTVFLVCTQTFAVSTMTVAGVLWARRAR